MSGFGAARDRCPSGRVPIPPRRYPALRPGRDDFVDCSDLMARPDITGIDRIIVEILFAQGAVFITDQPVLADDSRIEFNLDFSYLFCCINNVYE